MKIKDSLDDLCYVGDVIITFDGFLVEVIEGNIFQISFPIQGTERAGYHRFARNSNDAEALFAAYREDSEAKQLILIGDNPAYAYLKPTLLRHHNVPDEVKVRWVLTS